MTNPRTAVSGFTLIELMVTVAVIAILAAIAVPGMQGLINANRLSSASGEMNAVLQLARYEATRRNRRVTVCRSTSGTACNNGTNWSAGWVVLGEGDSVAIRREVPPASIDVSGPASPLIFTPSGMVVASETITVCVPTTNPNLNQRQLTVNLGGAVTTAKVNGSGACP